MSGSIFEDWEFSFFKVSAENLNEHERSQTSKWISDINIETAILLLKNKDCIAAEQKIEYGLGNDNESIQAWNNKGYLLVMRGENADEALLKRDQLIENNPAKLMQAKAEHARWIHMLDKTPEGKSRKRALTILEDVFMRPASDPEPHFLYLKVLSSEVRTSSDSLDKWVDQLEWFADNRIEQDELLIWLEITDVLYVASFDSSQSAKISGALQRISSKLSTQMTLENTAQKLLDLVTKTDEIGPANLYAKVAKSLSRIDFGDQFFDIVEIQEKLQKALKIGEMYRKGNPGRIEMGPTVCGNILLYLWALRYCEKHEAIVRELYALDFPEHSKGESENW